MEMMNRAVEDARDFKGMVDKIKADALRLREAALQDNTLNERRFIKVELSRLSGENRAEHRARLKRERREAKKTTKVPT